MSPAVVLVLANILTLEGALRTADTKQPELLQARALTTAANERAAEAFSPILPQVSVTAGDAMIVSRGANVAAGTLPTNTGGLASYNTYSSANRFSFGLTATQYIWDFGQTTENWNAKKETAKAQNATEHATRLQIQLTIRNAYFNATQTKALVGVAQENLKDQTLHLTQTQGFVKAGAYPEINLATAETSVAQAQLSLIQAQNNYETAKVALNQAMGVMDMGEYDVSDEWLPAVPGEDAAPQTLLAEGEKSRPDLVSFDLQERAQEATIASVKGAYWPSIGAALNAGGSLTNSAGNGSGTLGVNLTWPVFQGFLTTHQEREQQANLLSLQMQREQLRQQVDAGIIAAQLSVKAGKASVLAAEKAVINAREQLRLAEARYQQGVGNVIELTDAQAQMVTAAAQQVQANYTLASARATLIDALGRETPLSP